MTATAPSHPPEPVPPHPSESAEPIAFRAADASGPRQGPGADPQAPWETPLSARRKHLPIFLLSALVIGLALLFRVTPEGDGITALGYRLPESCLVRKVTDQGCPGCGLTRSFTTGVRLDPQAFRFHPLGPFLLLVVVAQIPYRGYRLWKNEPHQPGARPPTWPVFALGAVGLLLLATWFARAAGVIPS